MNDISDTDKLEALKCAYRAGAGCYGNIATIDSAAEIRRARTLLRIPIADDAPSKDNPACFDVPESSMTKTSVHEKPWTMELSRLSVRPIHHEDGHYALVVCALIDSDFGIYVTIPVMDEMVTQGTAMVVNILGSDLTNAFDSILWMWNNPDEAEHEGYMAPDSATRIKAYRGKIPV